MIPAVQQNFPSGEEAIVEPKTGKFTHTGRFLLLALFNRGGGSPGVPLIVGDPITAAGTTQATATELSDDINEIGTVPLNSGVALFSGLQPGQFQMVYNNGINSVLVYPFLGAAIDIAAVNAPYTLVTGKMQIFWCMTLTQVRSTQLG